MLAQTQAQRRIAGPQRLGVSLSAALIDLTK
jgi:hypothetical protein